MIARGVDGLRKLAAALPVDVAKAAILDVLEVINPEALAGRG